MNFIEILDQLNQGRSVRRATWPMKDGYLVRMMGFNTIWKVLTVPTANAGNYLFTTEDFGASDWMVIESYSADEENKEEHVVQ